MGWDGEGRWKREEGSNCRDNAKCKFQNAKCKMKNKGIHPRGTECTEEEMEDRRWKREATAEGR
jgi:hypothetical protein